MRACGPRWTSPSWKPACELAWLLMANSSERACSQEPFTHVPWSSNSLGRDVFKGPDVRSQLREDRTCRELRRLSRTLRTTEARAAMRGADFKSKPRPLFL